MNPSPTHFRTILRALLLLVVACAPVAAQENALPIKVGIIGLDAHAVPWTRIINGPTAQPPVSGMRIVAACPSFSPDVP